MIERKPTSLETAFAARASAMSATQALAYKSFEARGLPHRRVEGWRWSDFRAALNDAKGAPASKHDAAPRLADDLAALKPLEIRIVNGRIDVPAGAPPDGLRYGVMDAVGTIAELENHPLAALNVAMTRKACAIEIADGAEFAQPILIRHVNAGGGFSFSQCLMRVGAGACATLIETFEGAGDKEGAGLASNLFHMDLRRGARLDRAILSTRGADAITHSIGALKVDGEAHLNQAMLSTGSRIARHETHVHYVSAGASADLASAALLAGERHNDFTSEVLHLAEGCTTRQTHKGVAAGKARNVFQGKFRVMRAAQKTDAQMKADALLLSDTAEANHKPELEIYADDVQCAHGSTAGALDANAVFYMRQRGLSDTQARALLIEAFVSSAFDNVAHPGIREAFRHRVSKWLETV